MLATCAVASVYALTVKVGLLGNCWVVSSVMRSRRPRNMMGSLSPSDRLRTYIGLLAVLDLLVIASLVIRVIYVLLPYANTEDISCRVVFVIDNLVKLASLTCLSCISMERYITIRKPFSSRIRKRFIQFTPLLAMCMLVLVLCAIGVLASSVRANAQGTDCVLRRPDRLWARIPRWLLQGAFMLQLLIVSANYGQIVRHVRRKFWQRKARCVAHATQTKPAVTNGPNNSTSTSNNHSSPAHLNKHALPAVAQPRYMRDMTAAIVRIAFFHVCCWLPFCLVQLLAEAGEAQPGASLASALRAVPEAGRMDSWRWTLFAADWLTYVNSAGNWILYAAMNKDLRSIIRATTERRKRSTMSQSSPPSNLHRSLRRHMAQSLRFFYSINSYRSNGNSFDDSYTTGHVPGGSIDSSSPMNVARSVSNAGGQQQHHVGGGGGAEVGLFGMRNGRAHTYCSPRSSNGLSICSGGGGRHSPAGARAQPASSAVRTSRCASPKPLISALMSCSAEKSGSQERFL